MAEGDVLVVFGDVKAHGRPRGLGIPVKLSERHGERLYGVKSRRIIELASEM